MFTIELILKYTPMPFSVQRKEKDGADALYQQILAAITSGSPKILELTCEKQEGKKIAILSSEISAVQVSEKSSAGKSNSPGFFALAE
jgi:hypothetical protein